MSLHGNLAPGKRTVRESVICRRNQHRERLRVGAISGRSLGKSGVDVEALGSSVPVKRRQSLSSSVGRLSARPPVSGPPVQADGSGVPAHRPKDDVRQTPVCQRPLLAPGTSSVTSVLRRRRPSAPRSLQARGQACCWCEARAGVIGLDRVKARLVPGSLSPFIFESNS